MPFASYADKKGDKNRAEWRKEMREFKIKFVAQEIELQENQEKQFISIYNQMCDERQAILVKAHQAKKRVEKLGDAATDEDYRQASEAETQAREADADIEKRYNDKFKTFLSQKQMFKMKEAEGKFREKLMKMRGDKKKEHKKESKKKK
jgi:hypothetical protein